MFPLLDTSSPVHFGSSPLLIPQQPHGLPFPKRSAPLLFTKAPLGGLKPSPVQRLRWVISHLTNSTILITACSSYYCRLLLLGTLSNVRSKLRQSIGLLTAQIFALLFICKIKIFATMQIPFILADYC